MDLHKYIPLRTTLITLLTGALVACGGDSDNDINKPTNSLPIAQAGENQTVDEKATVTLHGSGTDNDGVIKSYQWQQLSGPPVLLSDQSNAISSFVAPDVTENEELSFELTVIDDEGGSATDQVVVTVNNLNNITIQLQVPQSIAKGSWAQLKADISSAVEIDSIVWEESTDIELNIDNDKPDFASLKIPEDYTGDNLEFTVTVSDKSGYSISAGANVEVAEAIDFVDYTGDHDEQPLEDAEVIATLDPSSELKPATRAVDGYTTFIVDGQSGVEITPEMGRLTLTTGALSDIQVGDIIVGVTTDGDTGFMREVLDINGNILTTSQAPLHKAFPDADVKLDLVITNQAATLNQSISTANNTVQSSVDVPILTFSRTLQQKLSPEVTSVVELKMNSSAQIGIEFSIIRGEVTHFSTIAQADYLTNTYLKANYSYKGGLNKSKVFNPIINKNVKLFVGPIPLFLNVKLHPQLGANVIVAGKANLKMGISASGNYRTGFKYQNEKLSPVHSFVPVISQIGPEYELSGETSAKVKAELQFMLSAYELSVPLPFGNKIELDGPGAGLAMGPYAKYAAKANYKSADHEPNCKLELSVGLGVNANLDYGFVGDILGLTSKAKKKKIPLYDLEQPIWGSEVCPFETQFNTLTGAISDVDGSPISDADVSLTSVSTGLSQQLSSDTSGAFSSPPLAVGDYHVIASKSGFQPERITITVTEDTNQPVQLILLSGEPVDGSNPIDDNLGNPRKQARVTGDPNLRTFDGLNYGFNGVGEYILAKSNIDTFEIQGRYVAVPGNQHVSFNAAVAANVAGTRVTFYPNDEGLAVLIDGQLQTLNNGASELSNQASIFKQNNRHYEITWPDTSLLKVYRRGEFVETEVLLPNSRAGSVNGLLGYFDGNVDNDLTDANGNQIEDKGNFNQLYDIYGNSWRVTSESSLFDYFNDETPESFVDLNFPRTLLTQARLEAQIGSAEYQRVKELCQKYVSIKSRLEACIIDVALTGNESDLSAYRAISEPTSELTLKVPPQITILSPTPGAILSSNILIEGKIETVQSSIAKLFISINGEAKRDISFALNSGSFALTQPAESFVQGENNIILYATDSQGSRANSIIGFTFDSNVAPAAGGDLIVFNDVNILDNERIYKADNTQFAKNLASFSGNSLRAQGSKIVLDRSHDSRCSWSCQSINYLYSTWEDLGFEVITYQSLEDWDLDDPQIKLIVLWTPLNSYSPDEVSRLKQFAAQGGRIVFVGEHELFYGLKGIEVENNFLISMGAFMRNIGKDVYGGNHYFDVGEDNQHQTVQNVETLVFNRVSLLSLGPNDYPLVKSADGLDVIAGVARIDINNQSNERQQYYFMLHQSNKPKNPPSPIVSDRSTN